MYVCLERTYEKKMATYLGKKKHKAGKIARIRGKKPHGYRVIILKRMADHIGVPLFVPLFSPPHPLPLKKSSILTLITKSTLLILLSLWEKSLTQQSGQFQYRYVFLATSAHQIIPSGLLLCRFTLSVFQDGCRGKGVSRNSIK